MEPGADVGGPRLPAYQPGYLAMREADQLFERLRYEIPWAAENVTLFGRSCPVPRRVAWSGEAGLNYRYAAVDHVCEGWHPLLAELRDRLRRTSALDANLVLLNLYRDGQDAMGWHRDDEAGLEPLVASISLGATRRFLTRPCKGEAARPWVLEHGSLLLMDGRQPHTLPRTRRPIGERINLSFRRMVQR